MKQACENHSSGCVLWGKEMHVSLKKNTAHTNTRHKWGDSASTALCIACLPYGGVQVTLEGNRHCDCPPMKRITDVKIWSCCKFSDPLWIYGEYYIIDVCWDIRCRAHGDRQTLFGEGWVVSPIGFSRPHTHRRHRKHTHNHTNWHPHSVWH